MLNMHNKMLNITFDMKNIAKHTQNMLKIFAEYNQYAQYAKYASKCIGYY